MNNQNLPQNLCLTPFSYITFDPNMNVSPCPALGGSIWNLNGKTLNEVWLSQEFNSFRTDMLNNQKHSVCHRCWNEESVGLESERTLLWNPKKDPSGSSTFLFGTSTTAQDILNNDRYKKGPMQLAIKVSNICNLRCRSCNSADSITLSVEGKYFDENYGLKNNFWLKETTAKSLSTAQIDEIVSISHNVKRIEFYGGEPLIDKQLPVLLQKLIDLGISKNIQLNISTNVTHTLDETFIDILSNFEHVNINLSFDGWGDKFTYLRHPAKWDVVYKNVNWFINCRDSNRINMSLLPVITITSMNVFDVPELINNIKTQFGLDVYLILAWFPEYFSISNIPSDISIHIANKLKESTDYDLTPVINMLNTKNKNPKNWELFKTWTRIIDSYRNESFAKTFPNYCDLIKQYDCDELFINN